MQIEQNKIVSFHYTLRKEDGEILESSDKSQPLVIMYGHGGILPALERAMLGKETGESLQITLPPEQAYGFRRDDAEQRISKKHLLTKGKLKAGMIVKVNTDDGPKDVRIVKVGKFNVDVDTNHPFADLSLDFSIELVDVRDATPEEMAHGHVHGAGGHHH